MDFDPEQFRADADRIAEEVLAMSDEEVQAYLVEHGLEYLVTPERVDKALKDAMVIVRRKNFRVIK